MSGLFLCLLNMSIAASWAILAVLLLRLLLRKAPKWIRCLLWTIPALRLIVPNFWESGFSLLPSPEVIPVDIAMVETPAINSGIASVDGRVNPILTQHITDFGSLDDILRIAAIVWVIGVGIMLLYSVISWLRLRIMVRVSLRQQGRVYLCDDVQSPFILGIFRPRIYMPSGIDEGTMQHVIAHEMAHLRRLDHLWKPLGYFLLSIYWFNPFIWVAYILLCRDIEQACDEQVLKGADDAGKLSYAKALVDCSIHRRMILTCPVAFGEINIESRLKAIANYRKPAFWLIVLSLIACATVAVCFLTNPKACDHRYQGEITLAATCIREGVETHTCPLCDHSYTQAIPLTDHTYEPGAVEKEPTCTVTGEQRYTCTVCGATKREPVEKLPHQLGNITITKESNCTEEGECIGTCSQCGDPAATAKLPTNDSHAFINTVVRAATCAEPGEGINTCSLCQHSEPCQYPITDHTYETKTVLKKATCTQNGAQEVICSQCQRTETVAVSAPGHQWEGATCTKAGVCSVCNATGSKSDHSYQITSEESFIRNFAGKRTQNCTTCGHTKTEYVTASHSYDLNSIVSQLSAYAKKRGFQPVTHTSPILMDDYHITVFLRNDPSPAEIVAEGKKAIDQAYEAHIAGNAAAEQHTINIQVGYGEHKQTDSGFFNICIDVC